MEQRGARGRIFKALAKAMILQLTNLLHKGVDRRAPHGEGQLPHILITLQALLRLCKVILRKCSSLSIRPAGDVLVTTAASRCCECIEWEKPGDWIPLVVDSHVQSLGTRSSPQ